MRGVLQLESSFKTKLWIFEYLRIPYKKYFSLASRRSLGHSQDSVIIVAIISPGEWVSPSAEFLTVLHIILSIDDDMVKVTIVLLCWAFGLVISDLGSLLYQNGVVIVAIISP